MSLSFKGKGRMAREDEEDVPVVRHEDYDIDIFDELHGEDAWESLPPVSTMMALAKKKGESSAAGGALKQPGEGFGEGGALEEPRQEFGEGGALEQPRQEPEQSPAQREASSSPLTEPASRTPSPPCPPSPPKFEFEFSFRPSSDIVPVEFGTTDKDLFDQRWRTLGGEVGSFGGSGKPIIRGPDGEPWDEDLDEDVEGAAARLMAGMGGYQPQEFVADTRNIKVGEQVAQKIGPEVERKLAPLRGRKQKGGKGGSSVASEPMELDTVMTLQSQQQIRQVVHEAPMMQMQMGEAEASRKKGETVRTAGATKQGKKLLDLVTGERDKYLNDLLEALAREGDLKAQWGRERAEIEVRWAKEKAELEESWARSAGELTSIRNEIEEAEEKYAAMNARLVSAEGMNQKLIEQGKVWRLQLNKEITELRGGLRNAEADQSRIRELTLIAEAATTRADSADQRIREGEDSFRALINQLYTQIGGQAARIAEMETHEQELHVEYKAKMETREQALNVEYRAEMETRVEALQVEYQAEVETRQQELNIEHKAEMETRQKELNVEHKAEVDSLTVSLEEKQGAVGDLATYIGQLEKDKNDAAKATAEDQVRYELLATRADREKSQNDRTVTRLEAELIQSRRQQESQAEEIILLKEEAQRLRAITSKVQLEMTAQRTEAGKWIEAASKSPTSPPLEGDGASGTVKTVQEATGAEETPIQTQDRLKKERDQAIAEKNLAEQAVRELQEEAKNLAKDINDRKELQASLTRAQRHVSDLQARVEKQQRDFRRAKLASKTELASKPKPESVDKTEPVDKKELVDETGDEAPRALKTGRLPTVFEGQPGRIPDFEMDDEVPEWIEEHRLNPNATSLPSTLGRGGVYSTRSYRNPDAWKPKPKILGAVRETSDILADMDRIDGLEDAIRASHPEPPPIEPRERKESFKPLGDADRASRPESPPIERVYRKEPFKPLRPARRPENFLSFPPTAVPTTSDSAPATSDSKAEESKADDSTDEREPEPQLNVPGTWPTEPLDSVSGDSPITKSDIEIPSRQAFEQLRASCPTFRGAFFWLLIHFAIYAFLLLCGYGYYLTCKERAVWSLANEETRKLYIRIFPNVQWGYMHHYFGELRTLNSFWFIFQLYFHTANTFAG